MAASDRDMRQWIIFMLITWARMDSPSYNHKQLPSLPIEMWVFIWSFIPRVFGSFEFAFRNALHADPDQEYLLPYMNRSLFPKTLRGFQARFVQLAIQICSLKRVSMAPLHPHPSIEVSLDCCTMRRLKGESYETTPLFVSMFYAPNGQACHFGQPMTATNPWGEEIIVQDYCPGKPYGEAASIVLNVLINMDRLVKTLKKDAGDGEQCVRVKYYPYPVNRIYVNFAVDYEDITWPIRKRFKQKIQQELESGDIELFV